jgi:pimeloyl-[acyl-carrier protein] methyl ester esterase
MSVRRVTIAVAAALAVLGGAAISAALAAPASAQTPSAADPNRLFADSKLIVRDRISVEVVGHGPDLVLVPGLSSSRATWKHTAERLRGRYRLHLVQVAGFAGEPDRANATGPVVEPTAEAVDAYIVEAHLAPAVYIGHSLGGTMGLYLAEHHPEHLKKVLLVDSLPFFGAIFMGPTATTEKVRPIAEGMRKQMIAATPEQSAANSAATIGAMVKNPDGLREVIDWGKKSDIKVVANAMAEDLMLDMRPDLAKITTPVTLLYPYEASGQVPLPAWEATYHGQYAPLPTATLVRIDDSRHFIMFDQPAKFDAALDAFLAK